LLSCQPSGYYKKQPDNNQPALLPTVRILQETTRQQSTRSPANRQDTTRNNQTTINLLSCQPSGYYKKQSDNNQPTLLPTFRILQETTRQQSTRSPDNPQDTTRNNQTTINLLSCQPSGYYKKQPDSNQPALLPTLRILQETTRQQSTCSPANPQDTTRNNQTAINPLSCQPSGYYKKQSDNNQPALLTTPRILPETTRQQSTCSPANPQDTTRNNQTTINLLSCQPSGYYKKQPDNNQPAVLPTFRILQETIRQQSTRSPDNPQDTTRNNQTAINPLS